MLTAPVTVTPPAMGGVTLDQAKTFLRRDSGDLDTDIETMLHAALEELEATTSLRLTSQTVEVRADSFAELDALNVGPVTAITGIWYLDASGVEQQLAAATYYLTGTGLERGIGRVPGMTLPLVQRRKGAVRVQLAVGYGASEAAVPAQLRWAALALLRGKFEDRDVDIEPLVMNHRIYA